MNKNELSLNFGFYPDTKKEDNERGLGKIWARGNGIDFPEENWDDFIIGVLSEWSAGFYIHLENPSKPSIFEFIDGPQGIKLESSDSGGCIASFGIKDDLESGEGTPDVSNIPVRIPSVIAQILDANRAVFDHFERLDIQHNDLDNLRQWHLKLMIKEALLDKS